MAEVWLKGPSYNAIPYRVFATKTGRILAAIVFADDRRFYFAFSKEIQNLAKEAILTLPFISRNDKRCLLFRIGRRRVRATGWRLELRTQYDLDLFSEIVRFSIAAILSTPVKVRRFKAHEAPKPSMLSEEERMLYELAPTDVPTEVEEAVLELERKEGSEEGGGET